MMLPPLAATSLLGSAAAPSVILLTTDIGAALAASGVRFATSQYSQTRRPARLSVHNASRRYASLYHHNSPLVSHCSSLRTRTSSNLVPLDQRANFWHRSARSGKSPYDQHSPFKSADDAVRMRSVEQHWQKNIEKMNQAHEMMRRRHMDFMKRRLESQPYDVLFGWRNRLRDGLSQEVWVKGSDVLKAANKPREPNLQKQSPVQTSKSADTPSATKVSQPLPRSDEVTLDRAQTSQDSEQSHVQQPTVSSSISTLEYDPIANRMVHKQIDAYSSFTSISPSGLASDNAVSPQTNPMGQETSVRSEFEDYKARRLPENTQTIEESENILAGSTTQKAKAPTLAEVASRARLEDSFRQVHKSSGGSSVSESGQPLISSRHAQLVRPHAQTQASEQQTLENDAYTKYNSALESLAARLKDVGDRVERLQSSSVSKASMIPHEPVQAAEYLRGDQLLRKQFRDFRKSTSEASLAAEGAKPRRDDRTVSFKQLENDKTLQQDLSPEAVRDFVENQHVYEILAFDPLTSEVKSTTISAPASAKEVVMDLSDALGRLGEPAKFLPHLRMLKDQGFEPVTATGNMLILRGVPRSSMPIRNPANTGPADATTDGGAVPPPPANEQSVPFDRAPWARSNYRGWRRKRRFARRVLFWSAVTGLVIYATGLRSGYRSERRCDYAERQNPETEEELYRAMREGGSPRPNPYNGMRKVTYPKDREP